MSNFSHHEACPSCGSKDNLGVWEDGHKWCFGCKYYEHGHVDIKKIHNKRPQMTTNPRGFPEDAAYYIPKEPMEWLLSCGIDYSMQRQYGIQWSPQQQLVCWKLDDNCWQGRTFNPESKIKYISQGKIHEKTFIVSNNRKDTVVLVEDYLSAIRVSTYLPCMPLFGCTIKLELLQDLLKRFKTVLIWLDADKLDNARKISLNANLIGLQSHVLYTKKDPKNYTNLEIQNYLEVFNDTV